MNSRDEENKLRQIKEDITGKPHPDPIAVSIDNLTAAIYNGHGTLANMQSALSTMQCELSELNRTIKRVYKLDGNM